MAGKRKGLDGERSGLFMEQVRIAKEMRKRDEQSGRTGVDVRCRYLIWENVPGALSSGKPSGEDSDACWKSWQGSSMKESLFLDLRRNGVQRESSSETDIPSLGGSWMPNTTECLNGEGELLWLLTSTDTPQRKSSLARWNTTEAPSEPIPSHLSEILEEHPDLKYRLSAKACQGILNRASRRGKSLPPMLQEALEQMILLEQTNITE